MVTIQIRMAEQRDFDPTQFTEIHQNSAILVQRYTKGFLARCQYKKKCKRKF